ncbi:MAG: rhodanese-like domain-containing protein [Candidatus Odinarchaeota archaeon]
MVYCGVGGYASTLFFVLHEILGYRNVKVYDGSWQMWSADPSLPVELT